MAHSILKIDKYGRPYPGWSQTPPLPLMPDTFVDWLTPKLRQDMTVFEFGSGNSTLYFAQHCRSVISAEHHILWGTALGKILPPNVTMVYFPLNRLNQYVAFIDSFQEPFDIVVVDGMVREECIRKAVGHLKPDGMLILDNSDSEAFEGQGWLAGQGFDSVRFDGEYRWAKNGEVHSTTVFFKSPDGSELNSGGDRVGIRFRYENTNS